MRSELLEITWEDFTLPKDDNESSECEEDLIDKTLIILKKGLAWSKNWEVSLDALKRLLRHSQEEFKSMIFYLSGGLNFITACYNLEVCKRAVGLQ